jgi:hypothetical protein
MTDDQLRLHLESLHASVRELYEAVQRHDAQLDELSGIARNTLASIQSLERIATAHQDRLDDHQQRLEDLEDK